MNRAIEQAFTDFPIPVSFIVYGGHADAYVTYQQTDIDEVLHADDSVSEYKTYYDFDVYVKNNKRGNYYDYIAAIKEIMENIGFMWEPTRDSGDMFEPDTQYFHKTICFSYDVSLQNK